MEIQTYTERATIIFHPDGGVKGAEAHEHTGFIEERDVPDSPEDHTGPEGKVNVFVVVKQEVRAIEASDLDALAPEKAALLADAAAKGRAADEAQQRADALQQEIEQAQRVIAKRDEVIAGKDRDIAKAAEDRAAERAKLKTEIDGLRSQVKRLSPKKGKKAEEK